MATTWACGMCTFVNEEDKTRCGACEAVGPCAWECSTCTLVNWNSISRCRACDSYRKVVLRVAGAGQQGEASRPDRPLPSSAPEVSRSTASSATAEAPMAPERCDDQREALKKMQHDRYLEMKKRNKEREEERARIKSQIQEDIRSRKQTFEGSKQPPKQARVSSRDPGSGAGEVTSFEIAVRYEDGRTVKHCFEPSTTLREVRAFATKARNERNAAQNQGGEPARAGPAGSAGATLCGGTYHLQGWEEIRKSREIYEEQKQRIIEEARKVREQEWLKEQQIAPATAPDEETDDGVAQYELVDPLSRNRYGEAQMDVTLARAGMVHRSVLVFSRASGGGLTAAGSSTVRAPPPLSRAPPAPVPVEAVNSETSAARVEEREEARRAAAAAASRRIIGGGGVVSDSHLVATRELFGAQPGASAPATTDVRAPAVRTGEAEDRARAAAAAAERRLRELSLAAADKQEQASEAVGGESPVSVPAPEAATGAAPRAADEASERERRQKQLKDEFRRRAEERKSLRRELEAERRERVIQREQLQARKEAEKQEKERELSSPSSSQERDSMSPASRGDVVDLRVRKLNGEVVRRTFRPEDTMRAVLGSVLSDDGLDDLTGYGLLVPFPAQEFTDSALDVTLRGADLCPRGTVCMLSEATRGQLRTTSVPARGPEWNAEALGLDNLAVGLEAPADLTYESLLQLEERGGAVSRGASRDAIRSLPQEIVTAETLEESPMCPICRCDYSLGDVVVRLPCRHLYHDDCIVRWLGRWKVCPVCRREVRPGECL